MPMAHSRGAFLAEWLSAKELILLDSAVSSNNFRQQFLDVYKNPCVVLNISVNPRKSGSKSTKLLKWLLERQPRFKEIWIFDSLIPMDKSKFKSITTLIFPDLTMKQLRILIQLSQQQIYVNDLYHKPKERSHVMKLIEHSCHNLVGVSFYKYFGEEANHAKQINKCWTTLSHIDMQHVHIRLFTQWRKLRDLMLTCRRHLKSIKLPITDEILL